MQRTVLLPLVVALVTSLATVALWHYFGPHPAAVESASTTATTDQPDAERAPSESRFVAAEGSLEPLGGLVDVGGLPGDRLQAIHVTAGDVVAQGQELAVLESLELRQAELAYAKAALKAAEDRLPLEEQFGEAIVAEAKQGIVAASKQGLEVEAHSLKLAPARQGVDTLLADMRRIETLEDSIVSPQERSHLALKVAQAEAEMASGEKLLAKLEESVKLGQSQADAKLIEAELNKKRLVSNLQLDTLRESVKMAEARLKLATVRSPSPGVVLQLISRVGETIGPKPILRLADTSQMVAVTEVDESQIRLVKRNQEATISSPALAEDLTGVVTEIGRVVGKNEVVGLEPTKSSDARVVKVRVLLDKASTAVAASLVNLQVTVRIDTEKLRPEAAAGGN